MDKKVIKSLIKFSKIAIVVTAICWVLYRIFILEITNDEAWSFHMAYKVLYRAMPGTANNHWLNTIFIFFETHIFGVAVWKIRIHSLLAFIIYVSFVIKICNKFPNQLIGLFTIILLLLNTYVLDFFSLARGYALGMAFGMWSIYYILHKTQTTHYRLKTYTLLCLAAFSVYTHVYFLLAFALYELIFIFKIKIFKRSEFIAYCKPLWLPIGFLAFAVINLWFIKKTGDLTEGQDNGFIQDTISVFIQRSFEPIISSEVTWIISLLIITIILLTTFLPKYLFKSTHCKELSKILLLAFLIHQIFFILFNIPFPFGRTALYFMLPATLLVGMFFAELKMPSYVQALSSGLLGLIAVGHIGFLTLTKNINTTNEWWNNQGVGVTLDKIKTTENRNLSQLKILYFLEHHGVFQNYYTIINDEPIFKKEAFIHNTISEKVLLPILDSINTFDYIFLPDYDSMLSKHIDILQYDSLSYHEDMKTWLLKKKL